MPKTAAWQRKEGKSKSGGLNKKGVASYRMWAFVPPEQTVTKGHVINAFAAAT